MVRSLLLDAAGHHRTPRRNLQLAGFLALVAGVLNSVGFVAVAAYTSHMTGLVAGLADHLVLGGATLVGVAVLGLASFVTGAATCALVFNWGRRRALRGRYANVLVVEAVLVLVFGLLADSLSWRHADLVVVAVLCFTMGLQNAVITKISGAQIRTTHVTGMVTDIGIELGKLAYRERTSPLPPVVADPRKLVMLTMLVGLFFVGGLIGALGYLEFGYRVVVPVALTLLLLSAGPVAADLRDLRQSRRD